MKYLAKLSLGYGLYVWFVLIKRGSYEGGQQYYKLAQSNKESFLRYIARFFLESRLAILVEEYKFYKENINRDRLTQKVIEQYSDDGLMGYGDENFDKGGGTLQEQQRGLILPLLEKAINELPENDLKGHKVVEIGTGNGDVLAFLAQKYPHCDFLGVDFSVTTAKRKHGQISNLTFVSGYAFDLINQGSVSGDIVFASSTFIVFTPMELQAYFNVFRDKNFSQIVLNEPTWAANIQVNDSNAHSLHLEGACWHHNYCGYIRQAGYIPSDFSFFHYKHPISQRPDIFVSLIRATRDHA